MFSSRRQERETKKKPTIVEQKSISYMFIPSQIAHRRYIPNHTKHVR